MKQQINLYLPDFKVKKDPLTVLLMARIFGGVVAILVLGSAYLFADEWLLRRELAALQQVLIEETRNTEDLDDQLARRSQNADLSARLEQAELRLEASRQIRDFFSDTNLGNVTGFSEYFKDLSRASINGLYISSFSLTNGGEAVTLAGQARDSAMVPQYVNNIERGGSALRDRKFSSTINLTEEGGEIYSFLLSTSRE